MLALLLAVYRFEVIGVTQIIQSIKIFHTSFCLVKRLKSNYTVYPIVNLNYRKALPHMLFRTINILSLFVGHYTCIGCRHEKYITFHLNSWNVNDRSVKSNVIIDQFCFHIHIILMYSRVLVFEAYE